VGLSSLGPLLLTWQYLTGPEPMVRDPTPTLVSSPTEWPTFSVYLEELQSDTEEFTNFSLSLISQSANVKADNLARKIRTEPHLITYVNNIP